jgi:flagellar assembly protein FliH
MVERLHKSPVSYRLWEPTRFDLPAPEHKSGLEDEGEYPEGEDGLEETDDQTVFGEDLEDEEAEALMLPTAEEIEAIQEAAAAEGRAEGFEEGHKTGHEEGYRKGHEEGHKAGYEQSKEAGHKAGHEAGFNQGYQEGRQKGEHESHTLHALVEKLDEALSSFDVAVAQEVASLAVEIARRVVGHALQVQPEHIIDVVREALHAFPYQEARIHLHAEDLGLVRDYFKGIPGASCEHRFMEDASLLRGGCRIDVGASQFDARLQTRWQRVLSAMGGFETQWGIPSLVASADSPSLETPAATNAPAFASPTTVNRSAPES